MNSYGQKFDQLELLQASNGKKIPAKWVNIVSLRLSINLYHSSYISVLRM